MILYLSSKEHTNLLDFTGFYEDNTVTVKKIVGRFILKQFIIHDMRNFSHCSELILDRPAFSDSDSEFAQAIEEFLTMYDARITVIYEGLPESDPLFAVLLNIGVGNIVTSVDICGIQTEIRECLSEKGMTRYIQKSREKPKSGMESYQFNCENIHVAVISSQARMGATTTAVGLSTWLNSVGGHACYVESNQSGHLVATARAYEMERIENGFAFDGMDYLTQAPTNSYNFVVCDIGKDYQKNMPLVETANIVLLCCGIKPYEMQYTAKLLRQFENADSYVICPFADNSLKENYVAALQSDYHKPIFINYQPDMMNTGTNSEIYKSIVQKYITGA